MTSTEQFNAAVTALVATGLSRADATRVVAKANPALHAGLLSEANPKASIRVGTPVGQNAVVEWNRKLEAKLASGLPRMRAVAAVVKENPDLHRSYLAAANAGRPSAQLPFSR